MQFGLVLTVCTALASGGEHCTDKIKEVRDTLPECLHLMDAQPKQPDDRYFSCAVVQRKSHKMTVGKEVKP